MANSFAQFNNKNTSKKSTHHRCGQMRQDVWHEMENEIYEQKNKQQNQHE